MRKLIDRYYRLLNALLVVTVAILVVPVAIQILSRHTPWFRPGSGPRKWRASSSSG